MSKRSKKVTVKGKAKVVKRLKAARKSKSRGYDIHRGKPTGRAVGATERLEKLTEKYEAEGMSHADARNRARAEMRGSRMDWRAG
jgi:hypothetical protein